MVHHVESEKNGLERIVDVDFAGPSKASDQRRKILGIVATRISPGMYRVSPDNFNARLLENNRRPGWTAIELAEALLETPARVVAFDFPFSIPRTLLSDARFAEIVGHDGTFKSWTEFNRFVSARLPLESPLDFSPFARWRDKTFWLKRETDTVTGAHPPLKHQFQVLFNMTLLGNSLLARLADSGSYDIIPFRDSDQAAEVVEIYPGFTMRSLGRSDYKRDPSRTISTILDHCSKKSISVDLDPSIRAFCETYDSGRGKISDPDGSDAFIALATGILYREGQCENALEDPDPHWRSTEGTIWGPVL